MSTKCQWFWIAIIVVMAGAAVVYAVKNPTPAPKQEPMYIITKKVWEGRTIRYELLAPTGGTVVAHCTVWIDDEPVPTIRTVAACAIF